MRTSTTGGPSHSKEVTDIIIVIVTIIVIIFIRIFIIAIMVTLPHYFGLIRSPKEWTQPINYHSIQYHHNFIIFSFLFCFLIGEESIFCHQAYFALYINFSHCLFDDYRVKGEAFEIGGDLLKINRHQDFYNDHDYPDFCHLHH